MRGKYTTPEKQELVVLTAKEKRKSNPCPKHGKDYLVKENHTVYCYAPTPGEMTDRCFFHVNSSGFRSHFDDNKKYVTPPAERRSLKYKGQNSTVKATYMAPGALQF